MPIFFLVIVGSICWAVFWPPRNSLGATLLVFLVLCTVGGFLYELSARYKIVPRDENEGGEPPTR